ncbi:hypothetical protein BS78_10G237900 [Paspalum vaginatum]|uniref:F-box domain-containing protein n=1 Tax=Paspalum vaginatum TaxID=158149 RepID=A0A9W8CDB7_9POAL|nr:hypothetical protein BS78_K227900 [Paspalum vaginatum]KAJ1260511.1 hypothetical protein BS78_10G237800 [Paspalum vaginatum]KAJ1260512.1 hypothetical protein BS78_10G237900 [Paspalum vaginatum]
MTTAEEGTDRISELPDDILVKILDLPFYYGHAMKTASVSRRWEHLLARLPHLCFVMSLLGCRKPWGTPSEQRLQSMARTLRRRCRDGNQPVKTLRLFYRRDVAMECRYANEFIALANAAELVLHVQCAACMSPNDDDLEDAGPWSLQLPPATLELQVLPSWYSVRPPQIQGPGVNNLRSLTLVGPVTMLRQDFFLTRLPALEDLHIADCNIDASIEITSDAMPRLRNLRIADVGVATDETKAAINVLVDGLRTLRMSCYKWSEPDPPSEPQTFFVRSRFAATFTTYASFRLHTPRLQVFEWRCCDAAEVRIQSVGHLSDVTVELAAGRKPTPYREETRYVTTQHRDKLMTNILRGLMPGLHPRSWNDIRRRCMQRDDRWLCFQITGAYPVNE